MDGAGRAPTCASDAGHAHLRQRRRPRLHAHDRDRRQLHVHGHRQRWPTRAAPRSTVTPYGRITRLGEPHVAGYYILHEGLIGAFGEEPMSTGTVKYSALKDEPEMAMLKVDAGLVRHAPTSTGRPRIVPEKGSTFEARYLRTEQPTLQYQADFRGAQASLAPGASATVTNMLFAGAKQVSVVDGYEKNLGIKRFELPDRLGLVLFHHQADVLPDRLPLPNVRQFRRRHPARDRAGQGGVLPASQQVLQVDERDEEGAAANGRAPRAVQGRQGQAATGADGALQEGEDQSACRLLAGGGADPGLLLALQGAVRHHRDAARAVLRLDFRTFPRPTRPTSSPFSA